MKSYRFFLAVALAFLVAAPLASCSRKSKGPDVPVSEPKALVKMNANVNLLHKELEDRVASEIQRVDKDDLGRVKVDVSLRNRSKRNLVLQARTVFKDKDGLSMGDETAWKTLYLEPQQAITYGAASKIGGVETATVEVRLPKNRIWKKNFK